MIKREGIQEVILFYDASPDSRVAAQAVQRQKVLEVTFIETDDDSRFRLPCLMNGLFDLHEGSQKIIRFLDEITLRVS